MLVVVIEEVVEVTYFSYKSDTNNRFTGICSYQLTSNLKITIIKRHKPLVLDNAKEASHDISLLVTASASSPKPRLITTASSPAMG